MVKSGKLSKIGALVVLTATFAAEAALAQAPTGNAAVQQARLFNQRPTSATPTAGERLMPPLDTFTGAEAAADADIGEQWMLKPNLPVNPFNAYATLSLFYTSNVALSRRGALDDAFAVADVGLGYNRTIAQDWSFGVNLQQSFFRYDSYGAFDFESMNANLALTHQARNLGDIIFSLQYGFSRLTRGSLEDELYLGNTVALTATKLVQITSATSVDLNLAVAYTFADPENLERVEARLAVGYTAKVTRNITANAVARLEFYDYTTVARQDLLQSVALGARWDLTEWIFLSASLSAVQNISTNRVFAYQALNTGVSLTAHIRF